MIRAVLLVLLSTALGANELLSCDSEGPGYFKFTSRTVAQLKPDSSIEIVGKCFKNISLASTRQADRQTVHITARGHVGGLCVEFLIITTGRTSHYRLIYLDDQTEVTFLDSDLSAAELSYALTNGLFVLRSCDNLVNLPQNIFMTLKLFLGGLGLNPHIPIFGSKVPEYQLNANIDWVKKATGHQWNLRPNPVTVKIDKNNIKSGDYISIVRFDGLDNLIHVGSGSRAGHSAIAMWRDGELYILESQAAWYWPHPNIQKNKWDDWIQWAENADFTVAIIPLRDEIRAKLDLEKVWKEFDRLEGVPYGFNNFLFGYIDTENQNLPDYFDVIFISQILKVAEKIIPDQIAQVFYAALNMRLGTQGLSIEGLWEEVYKRNTTLQALFAQVEEEGWVYADGENYVCSAFVIKMYKAGGLFGDMTINSPEFTPKDLYELDFYDLSGKSVPPECQGHAPYGYCQVTGKIDFDMGRMNWVQPYEHMAEKCPTIAPDYNRTSNC